MIALEFIACICHIVACIVGSDELRALAHLVQCIADLVWCSVCACMQARSRARLSVPIPTNPFYLLVAQQTQHRIELDERDKHPPQQGGPQLAMVRYC